MAPNLKQKRITGILRPEALEELKKNRFSGRLFIMWEEGKVTHFNLRTEVAFNQVEIEEDDSVHIFGSF